jgi:hypothetical protein
MDLRNRPRLISSSGNTHSDVPHVAGVGGHSFGDIDGGESDDDGARRLMTSNLFVPLVRLRYKRGNVGEAKGERCRLPGVRGRLR